METCIIPVKNTSLQTIKCLLVIVIVVTLSACTKNPYTPINADVKAKFNYQPGTYWIYTDAISGETDSFSVRTNTVQNSNVLTEAIFMYITRYNLSAPNDTTLTRCMLSRNYVQTFALGATVTYPFKPGPIISGGYVLGVNSSYSVNGQTFADIAEITRSIQYPIIQTDTFYMNADVGIIKIIEYQKIDTTVVNRVWELQRWNIVR